MSDADTPETSPSERPSMGNAPPPPPPGSAGASGKGAAHTAVRGPIRNTLESIGMAVMMAVLLKYFVLEAYVIPTPSMQPTMMGSPEAGESDRILVDKFYYLLHEPERWDITVFRYPVRQVQSYVKRIVGVGGDRIKIAGGNLYQVEKGTGKLSVLRKPERIQRTLWREIYPMRRKLKLLEAGKDVDTAPEADDEFLKCRSNGEWKVEDGAFVGKPKNKTLEIRFSSSLSCNYYSDGYDLEVAKTTRKTRREGGRSDVGDQAVQDLAVEFELTPTNVPDRVTISLAITGSISRTFSLVIEKGQARLRAGSRGSETKTSEPFPFEIPAGEATGIRFARLDDQLYVYREGTEVGRFEVDLDGYRVLKDVEVRNVIPKITVEGKGSSRFAGLRVERDLHYTRSDLPEDTIIEVPEGHYYMMGDNTLGSADGRDWTAIEIGVDAKGNIVNPETPGARRLWGNLRPKPFESADDPHDDDNPVPMQHRDRVVFVDDMGEYHPLYGKIDPKSWGTLYDEETKSTKIQFIGPDNQPWYCTTKPARFVPRHHIQGRPIARFLRALSSFKTVGWIR